MHAKNKANIITCANPQPIERRRGGKHQKKMGRPLPVKSKTGATENKTPWRFW